MKKTNVKVSVLVIFVLLLNIIMPVTTLANNNGLTVKLSWEENNNKEEIKRPDIIKVELMEKGTLKETISLNKDNNWTYLWKNLKSNIDDYDLRLKDIPKDYTFSKVFSKGVYTFTGKYNTVTPTDDKIVVDNKKETNILPEENKNEVKKENIEIKDKVAVKKVDIPVTEVRENVELKATEKISITVEAIWKDEDNKGNVRPENLEIQLTKDGKAFGEIIKLNEDNGWKHTFADLNKQENGKDIAYFVTQQNVLKGYDITYSQFTDGKIVITNTYKAVRTVVPIAVEKATLTVENVWVDNENKGKTRPENLEIQLNKDGKAFGEIIKLNSDNNWGYKFEDLDKKENGKDIVYTVTQVNIPKNYEVKYGILYNDKIIITNTYIDEVKPTPDKLSIIVENIWKDDGNKEKTRPENLEIQLNKNGKGFGEIIKLNSDNGWKHTFTNLDKQENGKDIVYTVTEINVPKNYDVTYSVFTDGKIFITNTYNLVTPVVSKINVDVEKVWVDNNNKDKTRPKYIDVQLYKNGKAFGVTVRLNEDLKWKYTWKDLIKQENGKDIEYTVKEVAVPKGYTVVYSINKKSGAKIITNTKVAKTSNIKNVKGKTLPKTGIISTLGFSFVGVGFVLGGIYEIKKKDD